MWKHFLVENRDFVTTVTINRPPYNTLSVGALEELGRILDDLEENEATRVILLTGSGDRAFSAGADMTEFGQAEGGPEATIRKVHTLFQRIEHFPKPIIAVINGYALGGGCELQMACHLAVASDQARLGLPEVKRGILPGYGGTQRMARLIGKRRALYYMLRGEHLSAEEAKVCGLINEIFPHDQLREKAFELAASMARGSAPLAMRGIIRAVGRGLEQSLKEGLTLETEEMMKVVVSEDAAEGIQAFFSKREPKFRGR
jgi:enoyl-CoA hydratase/carnithine racemase